MNNDDDISLRYYTNLVKELNQKIDDLRESLTIAEDQLTEWEHVTGYGTPEEYQKACAQTLHVPDEKLLEELAKRLRANYEERLEQNALDRRQDEIL